MNPFSPFIAVCLPDFGVTREILLGFHAEAVTRGWKIEVNSGFDPNWTLLNDPRVDAVLVGPFTQRGIVTGGWRRVPIIAAGADLTAKSIPSVTEDGAAIGKSAAHHFWGMGYRNVAAFGMECTWFNARADALAQHFREAGGRFAGTWAVPETPRDLLAAPHVPEAVIRWVRELPRPVGILAGCDNWGRMLISWCLRGGIRVPEDVAILGIDNDPLVCETSIPPLSSVSTPRRRIGAIAARLIEEVLTAPPSAGTPAPLILVPPNGVVVRQSSDMFAVADANVATALRVIRDRATERLGVPDLLRQVPIGRHALQRAFRKNVGRTMVDEIRRVRVERAKSLLCTTDLPMPQIATRCGFSSAAKLSEMFRREMGTTPGAFRRAFRVT